MIEKHRWGELIYSSVIRHQ